MISAIIEILLGVFIWRVVPGWITSGSKGARDTIGLVCNIVGIIILIAGCLQLLRALGVFLF